jgi:hypothetical protein
MTIFHATILLRLPEPLEQAPSLSLHGQCHSDDPFNQLILLRFAYDTFLAITGRDHLPLAPT